MSIVTKSIVNADAEARYLSPGELDRIKAFVTSGAARLRIAETLTGARETIVKQAGDRLFQKRPDIVSPGGNAYGEEMTATCLRDMDYYLRLITYGVVAGDVTPIEEIGLVGVREEMMGGHDVHHTGVGHAGGMVKAQPMGHAAAAVVPYGHELLETERAHQRHHVAGLGRGVLGVEHQLCHELLTLRVAHELGVGLVVAGDQHRCAPGGRAVPIGGDRLSGP